MTDSAIYEPGEKTHRDENFPVASYLISKAHRGAVLAFYRFARAADDVADHPGLTEHEKIEQLDAFEATLLGTSNKVTAALPLRDELARRGLTSHHALDLLIAFRQDARKSRYRDWGELMQYCAYSAAPVGRFVLDVHGENPAVWPASDALCSVLQIINHIQDCKADYRRLNRIYIPQDLLAHYGATEEELAAATASSALRQCLKELTQKTCVLMESSHFALDVKDTRLSLEVATIEALAQRLLAVLLARDPLSERVHLNRLQLLAVMTKSVYAVLGKRSFTKKNSQLSRRSA